MGPALGAGFAEYSAEFEVGGELGPTSVQRFLYVLEGALSLEVEGMRSELAVRSYAYLPQGCAHRVVAPQTSQVVVIEKAYQSLASVGPTALHDLERRFGFLALARRGS